MSGTKASTFFFFKKKSHTLLLKNFIYFWLHWLFISVLGLSLIAASEGLLFVVVYRPLSPVASLMEHRL